MGQLLATLIHWSGTSSEMPAVSSTAISHEKVDGETSLSSSAGASAPKKEGRG
jgi:hypothetical protein